MVRQAARESRTGFEDSDDVATPDTGYSFARFWRCALQVNPWSYNADYRGADHGHDEASYNQALVDKCVELGIKVVGIADHGNVDAVDKLRNALQAAQIVVFPGFEIASTEKVHMVCLFREDTTRDQLNRYLGKLDLTDTDDGIRPSRLGCLELAKVVNELNGFWYAAHATGNNGLLRLQAKDGGGLTHVWTDSDLVRVAQIPGTVDGLPNNYQQIVDNKNPDYRRDRLITVINAKDVAMPEDLAEPAATSWIKMTRPSFDAFKIAFLDPGSRVRLNLSEEPHSVIESLRIFNGYLDGLDARFSDHLNALIGGRGTGKSTLLECIRYALQLPPKGKQAAKLHQDILKENLGHHAGSIELVVRSTSQHGQRFTISRRYGEPAIVRDAAGAVSQQSPADVLPHVEIYGQNEIFELAQDGPGRLRLLERFLPAAQTEADQRGAIQKKLADNAQRLAKARSDLDELREQVDRIPTLLEQLEGFKKLGVESKLANVGLLAREKQMVERVGQEVAGLEHASLSLFESLPDLTFLSDKAIQGLPGATHLAAMRSVLEELTRDVSKHHTALQAILTAGQNELKPHRVAWKTALEATEQELEQALRSLPNMAGKSGREVGAAYQRLTQEIERIKPMKAKEQTLTELLNALEGERRNLLAALSDIRADRATKLDSAVKKLNKRLKGKLRIKVRVEGDHSSLTDFLGRCKLDGVGEKRLSWIEEKEVKPLALAEAIKKGKEAIRSQFGVTPVVAEALSKLRHDELLELETIELSDHVGIELNVAHGDREQYKELSRLSTGQQCTAVLHLLLLDNPDPLIVDQPEDNLDNAFIAERIVRELRDAKTRRQFLFSTHNANIPVFGDAEWIGVLTAEDKQGVLAPSHQGSIDVAPIRERAAEILEGGVEAFNQRREMYEF